MTVELEGGGRLEVRQDGVLVRCEVEREDDCRGLYKVWLMGAQGSCLLGTLAPERGALRLCRRLSVDALRRQGCWPVEGGRCELAFAFDRRSGWRCEPADRRITDPVLRQAARGVSALVRGDGVGFRMAFPFEPGRPFSLTPAFCFAAVEWVEGRLHAVLRFDGQGRLRIED